MKIWEWIAREIMDERPHPVYGSGFQRMLLGEMKERLEGLPEVVKKEKADKE